MFLPSDHQPQPGRALPAVRTRALDQGAALHPGVAAIPRRPLDFRISPGAGEVPSAAAFPPGPGIPTPVNALRNAPDSVRIAARTIFLISCSSSVRLIPPSSGEEWETRTDRFATSPDRLLAPLHIDAGQGPPNISALFPSSLYQLLIGPDASTVIRSQLYSDVGSRATGRRVHHQRRREAPATCFGAPGRRGPGLPRSPSSRAGGGGRIHPYGDLCFTTTWSMNPNCVVGVRPPMPCSAMLPASWSGIFSTPRLSDDGRGR